MTETSLPADDTLLALTADVVAAHVSNNSVAVDDLPGLISQVHSALAGLGKPAAPEQVKQEPAVPVRSSVKPDYIVCLEDGAKLKMLKRYLRTRFDMSPEDYRTKWGLPRDYPMVAPNYAATRKELAHKIGLGRRKVVEAAGSVADGVTGAVASIADAVLPDAPKKRGRPKGSTNAPKVKSPTKRKSAPAPAE